jgi:serine phosphatase RsbU (regulator of sigma subunit)
MSHEAFDTLLHRQPSLAYEMVNVLGSRLTEAHDHTIHDLQIKNRELQQAYDELKAAQEQIIEKERLERELQVAFEIQMSILPDSLPALSGFDFGARIVPARAVGGDFYDVLRLSPDTVGVVVGDVTDKGVPSAIYMAQTHALLYAEAHRVDSPREVLKRANRHLMAMSGSSLFVTVLYGILDRRTGAFRYARAGHELPIISTEDGNVHLAPWSQGQPLGLLDEPTLDEQTVTIPPGGTLLLYTDGMFDDRNPKGEFFGLERLQAAVAELAREPAQETCDRLLRILMDFQGDASQDDDVTLVAVHSASE